MKKWILKLSFLGLAALMAGCQTQGDYPSQSATEVAATHPPMATGTILNASPTPTATYMPTVNASPGPTPDFPALQVANSLLLSTGQSGTCTLPCWNDLRVGESTQSDVQHAFRVLLRAENGYDFFAPAPRDDSLLTMLLDIKGVYAGGHNWYFKDAKGVVGTYYLYAFIDEKTRRLAGIVEAMNSFGVYDVPSLPEIIAHLGAPNWVYGGTSANTYTVLLYYEEGVSVWVDLVRDTSIRTSVAPVCMNAEPLFLTIAISDPFINLSQTPRSTLHEAWGVPEDPAPYVVKELGGSVQGFVQFVNGTNPCIQVPR